MQEVSFIMAFVAGAVSFLSPCVLPLVPGYLSFISGMSFDELAIAHGHPVLLRRMATNALFFIVGFSSVFIALGASATAIGQFLMAQAGLFAKIGGVVVILLGLHIMGIWKIGFLYRERRFIQYNPHHDRTHGLIGSYATGVAFAFAWTPCVGPILGAILAFAGTQETVYQGMALLSLYSLGLGLPFFLSALAMPSFLILFRRIRGYLRGIEVGAGVLVVAMGLLILTDNLTWVTGQLTVLNRFVW